MYWVYGGYVVLSIVAFATLSIFNSRELASGSGLARGFCAYVAVFWGIRVGLQAVFDVKAAFDDLVAQGRVLRVDDHVHDVHDRLRMGGLLKLNSDLQTQNYLVDVRADTRILW